MNERLTSSEYRRYDRHLSLPEIGISGQIALHSTSVLLIGMGGLGSPIGLYLAAAGVGRLGLVDFDRVEESNLQRQVAFGSKDVGTLKTDAAARRLRDLNPHVQIDVHPHRLSIDNARQIIAEYDIVADGSDNFVTRYLVNDACVLMGKPNVYGSIFRFEGQASVFGTRGGPCYRCLYDRPPPDHLVPSCAEGGVLGVLPGLIGTIQATEVLKLALGIGDTLAGRLLLVDALTMQFHTLSVERNPDCPLCGDAPTITELVDYDAFCGIDNHTNSEQTSILPEISPQDLKTRMGQDESLFLLDVRREGEYAADNLNGTLIPLDQLPERLSELTAHQHDEMIVVYCRSGARSARAVSLLHGAGYTNAVNLQGGILAWHKEVDDRHENGERPERARRW